MRPENDALHELVLGLSGSERPRICLLPTASGDPQAQIVAFHAAMDRRPCEASTISLFRLGESPVEVGRHLLAQDVVYVGGGNLVNLLALWREHGIDRILREANERGIVLCGYSAGSMCWFEHGITRGVGRPVVSPGLGLLAGSHCVHYSQDPDRRTAFMAAIAAGEIGPGLALDDHAAAVFREGEMADAVHSRGGARAWRVSREGWDAVERPLQTRAIDPSPPAEEPGLAEMRELRRSSRAGRLGGGPLAHRR
jgi:peptidase E